MAKIYLVKRIDNGGIYGEDILIAYRSQQDASKTAKRLLETDYLLTKKEKIGLIKEIVSPNKKEIRYISVNFMTDYVVSETDFED